MRKEAMQGIAIIEVLVAFFVVAILMLCVVRISLSNLSVETTAYEQSIASMRIDALFERLRDNWLPDAMQNSLTQWNIINQQVLPLGHGTLNCNALSHNCTAQITWVSHGQHAYAATTVLSHNLQQKQAGQPVLIENVYARGHKHAK